MNMRSKIHVRFATVIAFSVVCATLPSFAAAQDEGILDLLRRLPANPNVIKPDAIESAKQMLELKIQRSEISKKRLRIEVEKLKVQIEAQYEAMEEAKQCANHGYQPMCRDCQQPMMLVRALLPDTGTRVKVFDSS